MQSLIVKVADQLIDSKQDLEIDKDTLLANALVKILDCFNKINKIVVQSRFKKLTESKITDVGHEVSKILYLASQLVFILSQDTELFYEEALDEELETVPTTVRQDVILASIFGITCICDITDITYVNSDLETVISEKDGISESESVKIVKLNENEDTLDTDELTYPLIGVFVACRMICNRLDLSFENLVYNAKLLEKL